MKIDRYSWGTIVIDGVTYTSDVIIYPDRVDAGWWRKEGHSLHVDDIRDAIAAHPECLVIGTGALGVLKVPKETIAYIESKGIQVIVERTGKAVEILQRFPKDKKIVAALHLTC